MDPPIVWTPSPERIASATITRYREWLNETRGLALDDYAGLWQWSVDELEDFWASIWEFFEVAASEPYERVLTSREMPGAQWFPGARLSYAEHVLRGRAPDDVAIRHASELRPLGEWTWGELGARAGAVAGALREAGVVAGDRVAAYLPNIPETVAAFLGCASIGATWSSCAPEFGVRSVVDRFAQIEPKVLLAVDGYRYGGKDFDRSETIAALERELPTLRQTLVVPYLAGGEWELPPAELEFAQLPFDHPLWVLYSSGTTGLPKAIVHGQGGILLEHLKKLRLHLDARAGDRLFWFTTTGWMMWNFLVGGLLSEASIVLFDGNPAYPDLGTLWDLADAAGITSFGTSAGYSRPARRRTCSRAGAATCPVWTASARPDRRSRPKGSTGCATGSARTCGCSPPPAAPTCAPPSSAASPRCRSTAASCRRGRSARRSRPGARTGARSWARSASSSSPSPCPRCLSISGATRTGRAIARATSPPSPVSGATATGSRSPSAAPRSSPAAPTRRSTAAACGWARASCIAASSRSTRFVDALVVDVPDGEGSRMTLFVVLRDGAVLDDGLEAEIRRRIREDCSPRHVPDAVLAAPEIPRTLSGKILEVPVKRLLMGAPADEVASRDSLANPEALDWFAGLTADARLTFLTTPRQNS